MRIRIADTPGTQGAFKFRTLLRQYLQGLGHEVTDWSSPSDFDFVISRGALASAQLQKARSIGAKIVIQFGGGMDWSPDSARILGDAMGGANGIVYNSRFGQEQVHSRGIHPSCPETVIHNGAVQDKQSSLKKPVFMMACDQYNMPAKAKALDACSKAMRIIRKMIPGAVLWVAGDAPDLPGIDRRLGLVRDHAELQDIRQEASVLLHPIEGDHCPNTVLEALGQGIPVVCHENSGVPEIAGDYGRSIPSLALREIAMATAELWVYGIMDRRKWGKRFQKSLSMEAIAGQYDKFLRSLCA